MRIPRLREVRQQRLMTQQELAEKCGMSVVTVSFAERGVRPVRASTVKRLAKALGVRPAELLGSEDAAATAA